MALLLSIGNAFYFPASKSILQEIVNSKLLICKANSLTESSTQIGMIIGTVMLY